jgi:hypothetical protein
MNEFCVEPRASMRVRAVCMCVCARACACVCACASARVEVCMRVLLCDYVCLRVHMPAKQAHISDTTQRINQSSCFERFILDSPDESVACPMPMQYLTPLRAFLHFSQGVDLSLFSSLSLAAPPRFVVPHSTRSSESLGSVSDASESSDSVSLSARFFDLLCEALPRDDAVSRPLMS